MGIAFLGIRILTELGEGSLWHPNEKKLYWVDIEGKTLPIYNPATGKDKELPVGSRIGTVVPVKSGGALIALENGIHKIGIRRSVLFLIWLCFLPPVLQFFFTSP